MDQQQQKLVKAIVQQFEHSKLTSGQLKQVSAELKQATDQLAQVRAENAQLKEENERHLALEQTMRNKLIETVQLKDENKKLTAELAQLQAKLTQNNELTQKLAMAQQEAVRAREERDQMKGVAEKVHGELRSKEELVRNVQAQLERQSHVMQAELEKAHDERVKMEKEWNMAKSTVDTLKAQIRTTKLGYEQQLQGLRDEMKHEKDRAVRSGREMQAQCDQLARELEHEMAAHRETKAQQATANQAHRGEVDRFRGELVAHAQREEGLEAENRRYWQALESLRIELERAEAERETFRGQLRAIILSQ